MAIACLHVFLNRRLCATAWHSASFVVSGDLEFFCCFSVWYLSIQVFFFFFFFFFAQPLWSICIACVLYSLSLFGQSSTRGVCQTWCSVCQPVSDSSRSAAWCTTYILGTECLLLCLYLCLLHLLYCAMVHQQLTW